MEVPLLHVVGANLPGEHPSCVVEVELEVVGMRDVLEAALEQLVAGVADELAEGVVDLEKASVGRDERHADRGRLERPGEAAFALEERRLGVLQRAGGFALLAEIDDDPEQDRK